MDILNSFYSLELFDYGLLCLLLVAFGVQFYYYWYVFGSILRYSKKQKKGTVPFVKQLPPISVIICAKNESENLRRTLPAILEQNYPCFEVIVINDGSTDETEDLLQTLHERYPNLYRTFVPDSANIRSTKKLGLTLGIKAAKYELLLFTEAGCLPSSDEWIASMARNFTQGTEFVLGYGGYIRKKGFISRITSFDTLFTAVQAFGCALTGHPYIGTGRNLAYGKETFNQQKGFSKFLNLQSGEDDLFVNGAADESNTRVEISSESVTWTAPKHTFKMWRRQKERFLSTAAHYSGKSLGRIFVELLSRACFYLSVVAIAVFSPWILAAVATLFFLIRYAIQLIVINKIARKLKERTFYLSILLFDILLPVINLYIKLFSKNSIHKWK